MTSLGRPLSGAALLFDLDGELATTRAAGPARTARTLVKDGPLRVTLIALQAGGSIAEHSADGPITIHVLEGTLRLELAGTTHVLRAGQLVSAAAGERHALSAEQDAAFLLTIALPQRPG